MLQSMTGYGKAEVNTTNFKISTEIKTLNSKSLDIFSRIPARYKNKEIGLRKIIGERLQRGKIDISLTVENLVGENNCKINQDIVANYVSDLKELNIPGDDLEFLKMAIKMPEVFTSLEDEVSEEEWTAVLQCINKTIDEVVGFRVSEGRSLDKVLREYTQNISESLSEIEKYESERIKIIKTKLEKQLTEIQIQYDEQRFHQEMIYYIEKLDINEEKTRLRQHCKYFLEMLEIKEPIGKKLGFIAQEMGREINTIGSKANHSEIQKLVILMKDELEKIKEQANNIL